VASGDPVVTTDAAEAARFVEQGTPVVLVSPGADGPAPVPAVMGVMVGDPADPQTVTAAGEMAAELFPNKSR